jgi:hypothetical protein
LENDSTLQLNVVTLVRAFSDWLAAFPALSMIVAISIQRMDDPLGIPHDKRNQKSPSAGLDVRTRSGKHRLPGCVLYLRGKIDRFGPGSAIIIAVNCLKLERAGTGPRTRLRRLKADPRRTVIMKAPDATV